MSISPVKVEPLIVEAFCTDDALRVVLANGRELLTPLAWFPRLASASASQRNHWRLIGGGVGIHWPEVDEDISVERLLALE